VVAYNVLLLVAKSSLLETAQLPAASPTRLAFQNPSSTISQSGCSARNVQVCRADALPARGAAGTSTIAAGAGVDLDTVLRCLGLLAGCGFVERCEGGWRLRRPTRSGRS
jgi:hypothetical protein